MVDIVLTGTSCFFSNCVLGLFLGPNEQEDTTVLSFFFNKIVSVVDHLNGLLQIDDVDAITFRKDIRLHLRVPTTGLMTKMYTSFKKLFHA